MPSPPDPPDDGRIWAAYDALLRRTLALEEIADRLAATSVDPVALADYQAWKTGTTDTPR